MMKHNKYIGFFYRTSSTKIQALCIMFSMTSSICPFYVLWKYIKYLLKCGDELPPEWKCRGWGGKKNDSITFPVFRHSDKPSVWELPSSSHRRSRRWFTQGQCKHVRFARWLFIPLGKDGVSQTLSLIIASLSLVIFSPLWI